MRIWESSLSQGEEDVTSPSRHARLRGHPCCKHLITPHVSTGIQVGTASPMLSAPEDGAFLTAGRSMGSRCRDLSWSPYPELGLV